MSGREQKVRKSSRNLRREAKERVELIASRLPRVQGVFRRGIERDERLERIVVISDLHIGDPKDTLSSLNTIKSLIEKLESFGFIDELVLLGDVFDFWKAPINEALSRSSVLFRELFSLANVGRMIYLPGNHDHHVLMMYYTSQLEKNLKEGNLTNPELRIPMTQECPVMEALKPKGANVPLFMEYPVHQVDVQGKRIFLTHGHLLGFFERSVWKDKKSFAGTLILRRAEKLDLEDMEQFLLPFYEMLTLSAFVPGVNSGGYRVFRLLNRMGKAFGLEGAERTSDYRNRAIEQVVAEIEALLNRCCSEMPDYFVYGHTHRSGTFELPLSGVTAINTGCWLDDPVTGDEYKTMLEISDEARLIQVD
ncbi:MAG: metallophosphoesterase [Actinomycetota bacterium]|nr:metallophosphoesterase [Actinomycetota bacterium]